MKKWLTSLFKKEQASNPQESVSYKSVHTENSAGCCETKGPLESSGLDSFNIGAPGTFRITPSTVARVKMLVSRNAKPNSFLRFAVVSGGCSGFSYDFIVDTEINKGDVVVEEDGAKVVTDSNSIQLIGGSVLDYVDDASGSRFEVQNPNASHSCGCGSSFGV